MENITRKDIYIQRKATFGNLLASQKKKLVLISVLRLLVASLVIYFMVMAVKTGFSILWAVVGLMVILFFALVGHHKNQNDKRKLLSKLVQLNEKEIQCQEFDFSENNAGSQFSASDHPWSHDLDIFGEGSLYQYLNRCSSHTGPEKLANYLGNPVMDEDRVINRQEIIRELTEKLNLRQHFTANASLMKIDVDDYREIIKWSEKPVFIEKFQWTRVASWIMTVISLTVISAGIINPVFFKLLIPVILVNLAFLSPFVAKTNHFQVMVSKKHSFLKTYSILLQLLSDETFKHSDLKEIRDRCKNGSKAIKQLSSLLDLFDQRLNLLVGFVLNVLFLFDFFMLHRLARWNNRYKDDFMNWLDMIGKADALFSLSGFAYNHPENVFPEIKEDYTGLIVEDLGHPMIPQQKRVNNSLEIGKEKVVLITGANMAGKSTFLRSLGINMVLAYAGCPLCAKRFITGNYRLYTSMRTSDSLKDDESYFFAEIKRLKLIVDLMKENQKMLILLDEVLKGTNTTDKQKGSRGLIEKSVQHNVLCFIATHDLSLGEMENEYKGRISNYCFESYIKDLELTFDYKIMPGLAKNMNASFLMKKMGIMD